jgi:hypothetical protein
MNEQCISKFIILKILLFISFFSRSLTDEPAEYLHTQKQRHVYLEAEPGIWWSLVVQNPHSVVTNNGKQEIEWFENDLDDASLQSILKRIYKTFKVFPKTLLFLFYT